MGALAKAGARSRKKAAFLAALALLLAAWFLPSRFSAERYRARLEAGLEAVLHRPATFGHASFQILPQPRFTLDNVVIHEDPAFGREPLARIDRVDCELRWTSLWRRNLEFDRLRLSRPSFNMVRNGQKEWNFENFLAKTGVTGELSASARNSSPLPFDIEVEDARLNFKQGDRKKPLAIVDLRGRLNLDPARKRIRFNLTGNPIRTDLSFSPPGFLEISGEWGPRVDLGGAFDVALRTRGASVYSWVPLLTGTNAEIYGVVDADVRVQGTWRAMNIEGQSSIDQLHRWELLPPMNSTPVRLRYRATYESDRGRLSIESAEVLFGNSQLHVTGAVDRALDLPDFDLVVALERSRLEDGSALASRMWQTPAGFMLAGRLDGLVTIQGPPGQRRLGGFIAGRDSRLVTPSGDYPISNVALRLDQKGGRLDPLTLAIGPHCKIEVEGSLARAQPRGGRDQDAQPLLYEIKASTKSANLAEAVRFARNLRVSRFAAMEVQGAASSTAILRGKAWPLERPSVSVKADFRSARLLIPGLTEPVNIPKARLQYADSRLLIDGITAVIGSSVITGRLEHTGVRTNPWQFDLKANSLRIEEGAAWFDALGHRPSLTLLERIPGLGSMTTRRSVASGLFTTLNARGKFSTPHLIYRSLRLENFEASLDLSNRILGLSEVSFRAGNGSGEGRARVNMTHSPAEIQGEVSVKNARLETMASHLGPALRKTNGVVSGATQFRTRGLSRAEMRDNLQAEGRATFERLDLGGFDLLGALTKQKSAGDLLPPRRPALQPPAEIAFGIADRQITVVNQPINVEGASLMLNGSWRFDDRLDLEVSADLRGMKRAQASRGRGPAGGPASATIHLTGPLGQARSETKAADTLAKRSTVQ